MTTVYIEDMVIGQTAEYGKTITEADIILFAGVTGDNNPMHIQRPHRLKAASPTAC